jgi:hypothetical protein
MDYPYRCLPQEVVARDAMKMSLKDKQMFFQTHVERACKL